MSEIEFENEQIFLANRIEDMKKSKKSKMVDFIIKTGNTHNKDTANIILLVFATILIAVTVSLFISNSRPKEVKFNNLSPEVIKTLPIETQQKIYEQRN